MLTQGLPQDETDSSFGVISVAGSFNSDAPFVGDELSRLETKGTLIVAGDDDDDDDDDSEPDEKSNLSLPESVFLPSEFNSLLENNPLVVSLEVESKEAAGSCEHDRNQNTYFKHSASSVFLALLLVMTSFASWSYVRNSRNEIRQLNQKLQNQQSILPLALLLLQERKALNRRISLLEQQIDRTPSTSPSWVFDRDGIANHTYVMFENCYFKAAVTPGTCYKDWQSWSNDYQHEDVEKSFAVQLFNTVRAKSYQSYEFVEAGFKNMTFDGIEAIRTALTGNLTESQDKNESYRDLYEALVNATNIAKSAAVDGGVKFTRLLEKHVHSSLSGALNYSSSLLKHMMESVSDEEYIE
ncbi:hypothetical protein ACHAW6_012702 [Cyclotella cf. meneghiniana]